MSVFVGTIKEVMKNMDKHDYEEIGLRIRYAQRMLGYIDKDVAAILGVEVSSYRDMVHGRRPIAEEYLIKLCRKWNLRMDYIFYGYEESGIFWDDTPTQEKMIRNCAASISKQMRELLIIPEEERIDYMIEIQQGLQELMMSLQK